MCVILKLKNKTHLCSLVKRDQGEVPIVVQGVKNLTNIHEDMDLIPGLAQWLRIQHRLQTWLGSGKALAVAVPQAGSYSSDLTRSLGTSICCRCGPKNK